MPFVAAFGTLMFLLLMQFLIRYLPDLVGRGLPLGALAELIAYSLAYMVTLAVPMAWLIALLTTFGRLAESQAYPVAKSAGISLYRLAWPTLLVGAALTLGMGYFNNVMLPEANYRMAGLWRDIRVARPGFELEPGVFYTGLDGYAIRAESIPPDSAGLLLGVTVFDTEASGGPAVVVARRARLATTYGGQRLEMELHDGELHRRTNRRSAADRYERLRFSRHRLAFDLSDLLFERSDASGTRSDRTMRTSDMIAVIDSVERQTDRRIDTLRAMMRRLGRDVRPSSPPPVRSLPTSDNLDGMSWGSRPTREPIADSAYDSLTRTQAAEGTRKQDTTAADVALLADLDSDTRAAVFDLALRQVRSVRAEANATANAARWEGQRANRYRVEIYKKNSIALACLVFVLIGVPLGLAVARGGVGLIATLAVGVFLFYWITLVQGEKLADRGLLPPWLGMWAANVLIGLLGLYLTIREARDPAGRDPIRRLAGLVHRKR